MVKTPGRPPKQVRFERELRTYVTDEQYQRVTAEAESEQRSSAAMMRILLDEALAARETQ